MPAPESRELSWDDVRPVDLIGLEVGYRLVPLVDRAQGGELLGRIRGVRRKLSQDLGFLVAAVHIRDNLELAPNAYRINLSGVPLGESVIYPDRELAINPGRVFGTLQGIETRDPAFGMEAVWIETGLREHAQALGYTVVDATTVVATHLSHLVQLHAHELLGHEEVQQLLNAVAKSAPKLVEDLVPKVVPLAVIVKVLQGLLAERIPIRNLRSILETHRRACDPHPGPAGPQRASAHRAVAADRAGHRRPRDRDPRHHARAGPRAAAVRFASRAVPPIRAWSPGSPSGCSRSWPSARASRKPRGSRPCCWWRRRCARRCRASCAPACRRCM